MNRFFVLAAGLVALTSTAIAQTTNSHGTDTPKVPRFSIDYMDRSASPATNFYEFADGDWLKNNPVPPDKSRWASFSELAERNTYLIHQILEDAAADVNAPAKSTPRIVGDFYRAAMDTNTIEHLGFQPLVNDLVRANHFTTRTELFETLGDLHDLGMGGFFSTDVEPDSKQSSIYAFELDQGGLSLPDRDYYLKDSFASVREKFVAHVTKMFELFGDNPADAAARAATVMSIETELAKASRSRVELRDPDKNYNKFARRDLYKRNRDLPWKAYFTERKISRVPYVIVGQPEFFDAVDKMIASRPLSDWKAYLRWHVIHNNAPYLHDAVADENFAFYGKILRGQLEQEPRWKRASHVIDADIGEALGKLYVAQYFPSEARARALEMVENIKAVYQDRLAKVEWMTEPTREKALAKFARFTRKIGNPDKFRDYSALEIRSDDYLGDVRRSAAFEIHRNLVRIGKPVDHTEWDMTPPTVNAYYDPLKNEIVFPAGILQPPFFDPTMDDAVNYGGIGVIIGHEITHGYDDQGRKYDAEGNLNDWWTTNDATAFKERTQKVVDEFNKFEALPGVHVNGELTLGENLADLGGVSIAYEALERDLAKDPSKRKTIDGFTPEQRFFISFAQIWRTNIREAEAKRLITVDPHSPGQFRAIGPLVNMPAFYRAFDIPEGAPMWRPPDERAGIW